jgi:hypothetical protein
MEVTYAVTFGKAGGGDGKARGGAAEWIDT